MNMPNLLIDRLPGREIFPKEMPRYPNLWFYVDSSFLLRPNYKYAVSFLAVLLENYLGMADDFVLPATTNPNILRLSSDPGERSDFQSRIGPLQHYHDPDNPRRSHTHQVHARWYATPLKAAHAEKQVVSDGEEEITLFCIPASVHYEVATEDPLHPYADECPLCGITGDYDVPIEPDSEDYCIKIHDPLGLEFLVHGTVRGHEVIGNDCGRIRSLTDLSNYFDCSIHEQRVEGTEPLRLALIILRPYGKSCS